MRFDYFTLQEVCRRPRRSKRLRPFLEAMHKEHSTSKLAEASTGAVTELARSLRENHAASNDLWEEAIEATLSFLNEQS
jgi:hypothetical protein